MRGSVCTLSSYYVQAGALIDPLLPQDTLDASAGRARPRTPSSGRDLVQALEQ